MFRFKNVRQITKKVKKQPPPKKEEDFTPSRDWSKLKIFDIAANLSDGTFKGEYHRKKHHEPDFDKVIERGRKYGVQKYLFAAGYIEDALDSHSLAMKSDDFYSTIGVHPCRASEPFKNGGDLDDYFNKIREILKTDNHKYIAIGECGLDYDRFQFADKETQLKVFPKHFELTEEFNLPMYLHSRSTDGDFVKIIKENRQRFPGGVVHSFTGTKEELQEFIEMDLYIGVNGCSLKTQENLDVAKLIPLERLMIETDCPYCDIRNTHASSKFVKTKFPQVKKEKYSEDKLVKDRNEPCTIVQVIEVLAALYEIDEEQLCEIAWNNTLKMFNL